MGEVVPSVDASTKLVASGLAEAVVLACWSTVRWNVVGRNQSAAFHSSECGVHGAFGHLAEPACSQALDEGVAVVVALGEQCQEQQRQEALEHLRVEVGHNYIVMHCT